MVDGVLAAEPDEILERGVEGPEYLQNQGKRFLESLFPRSLRRLVLGSIDAIFAVK